ncbi:MAG: DUF6351 family protein [Pseudohongiellaceae bacterium]
MNCKFLFPAALCFSVLLPACSPSTETGVTGTPVPGGSLGLSVISSRADLVSGGDALVQVQVSGTDPAAIRLSLNGRDISTAFTATADNVLQGKVTGLIDGENQLLATDSGGVASEANLTLINHPITGPIVSGPHFSPIRCQTEESELGAALDRNCSATTRVSWYYKSSTAEGDFKPLENPLAALPADLASTTITTGATVPYIVRVEAGTINRAVYRIAVLDNLQDNNGNNGSEWRPDAGWNGRLEFSFGGGCGTNYTQGVRTDQSVLDDRALSRGYAHALSSMNVMGHRCNDVLSAETLMMIKEHFIENYGEPVWTVGNGGSGGAIQQLLITQNYPGLLDGLMPSLSFADSFSLRPGVADCRLLMRYFESSDLAWDDSKREAVEGYSTGTCGAWDRSLIDVIVADTGCGIAAELVYNAQTNPKGARCTIYDTNIASIGADPATGYGWQALDNVGLQYGLKALNAGVISKAEFIDLNSRIGGYDHDGKLHGERTVAQLEGLRAIYHSGRVNQAGGGLGSVPILQFRSYLDDQANIHDRFRDFQIRARIEKANGRSDNQVIWVYSPQTEGYGNMVGDLALDTMAQWLDQLAADQSSDPAIERIVRAKPAAAQDGCWNIEGARIDEVATFDGAGRCNEVFPNHINPRLAAGATLADDAVKCALKPVNPADYSVEFSAEEMSALSAIFPEGVCDYSQLGVAQVPLSGTWLKLPAL